MKRDMELIRKILFAIEDKYIDTWLEGSEIPIDGYDMNTIAYHCAILHDANLIYDYKGEYASGELYFFGVGRLTWEGHEFLDKIKNDTVWSQTKETLTKKGVPFVLDAVKEVATTITSSMIKSGITG